MKKIRHFRIDFFIINPDNGFYSFEGTKDYFAYEFKDVYEHYLKFSKDHYQWNLVAIYISEVKAPNAIPIMSFHIGAVGIWVTPFQKDALLVHRFTTLNDL